MFSNNVKMQEEYLNLRVSIRRLDLVNTLINNFRYNETQQTRMYFPSSVFVHYALDRPIAYRLYVLYEVKVWIIVFEH